MRTAHFVPASLLLTFGAIASCDPAPPPARAPVPTPSSASTAATGTARLPDEPVPTLELPADVHAVRERLELTIDPDAPNFNGNADLELTLDRPRDVVWLHGRGLSVGKVEAKVGGTTIAGRWEEAHPSGVARVSFASVLPKGNVTLHLVWEAPYVAGTKGLYVTKQAKKAYAATQFEAIDARRAFPGLDQPSAKIPYEVSLIVPNGAAAISNAKESGREPVGDKVRVRFAPTPPIPSYLVAFAVGPYDVVAAPDIPPNAVRAKPIPLRAVAANGRGPELAYALAHTGEIVAKLEEYFGIPYPYEKLDMLAIPDRAGAMENAGAITFSEDLFLVDPKSAPDWQVRAFGSVVTHELAHQWFGDLVTMRWWDDLWLNEAFATWTSAKVADRWNPNVHSGLEQLGGAQHAMSSDSLASARMIRQPIATNDDIENAFDGITYRKGAAVLRMFEMWAGEEKFRAGVQAHLKAHASGNATCDEFLGAISQAAGKDLGAAFHTFLDKPGVPFVEVSVACDGAPRLHVKQSRYAPLGSGVDASATWSIPFCAKYAAPGSPARETCALVDAKEADVPLEGGKCPDWVMPNARAGGYYRFALAPADLAKLRKNGLKSLDTAEKIAFGNGLRAAYARGASTYGDVIDASAPLATDPVNEVAQEPLGFLMEAHDWLQKDPARAKAEAHARQLFGPVGKELGFAPKPGEPSAKGALRRDVLSFLAEEGNDPAVRAELKKRGRAYLSDDGKAHPEAISADLAGVALHMWATDGDAKTFATLRAALNGTESAIERGRYLSALGAIRAPALADQARALAFDPSLRGEEVLQPIFAQLHTPEMRDATWAWVKAHVSELVARLKDIPFGPQRLMYVPSYYCDEAHADEAKSVFEPYIGAFDGGPRALANVVDGMRRCAKKRAVQEPNVRAYYAKK